METSHHCLRAAVLSVVVWPVCGAFGLRKICEMPKSIECSLLLIKSYMALNSIFGLYYNRTIIEK